MEQHPIPQNVTNFQFRLVGDMTLKQFGYLALGFIIAYIAYKLPLPFIFTWPLAAVFALGGIGFAFVPIEERPMDIWVLSFIKSVYSPTVFLWQKTKQLQAQPGLGSGLNNIPGAEIGIAVTSQVQNVVNRLFPIPTQNNSTVNSASVNTTDEKTIEPKVETNISTVQSSATPTSTNLPNLSVPPIPPPLQIPVSNLTENNHPISALSINTTTQNQVIDRIFEKSSLNTSNATSYQLSKGLDMNDNGGLITQNMAGEKSEKKPGLLAWLFPWFFKGNDIKKTTNNEFKLNNKQDDNQTAPIINPEQNKKTEELEQMVKKLQEELTQKENSQTRILELQNELTRANMERQKLSSELNRSKSSFPNRVNFPRPINQTGFPQTMPSNITPNINIPKPNATPVSDTTSTHIYQNDSPTVKTMTADQASTIGMVRLTTIPNIITGVVKDNENNLLVGILITVRDKNDIPQRAHKTNKLGQFAASIPLPDGTYFVEFEDPRGRFTFDRAQITLNGQVVPPLEITAKSQKEVSREKLAKEIFGNNNL